MTIKEQLADLGKTLNQRTDKVSNDRLMARLLSIKADLEDPDTDIPADVLEVFSREERSIVLLGFVAMTLHGLTR